MSKRRRHARSKTARKKGPAAPGEALLCRIERLADSDPAEFGFLVGRICRMLVERERET